MRCWGDVSSGKLGYGGGGIIGDDEAPASAGDVSLGEAAVRVVAGYQFACALLASGSVRCWGDNFFGQLGYGNTTNIGDDETPASAGNITLGGAPLQVDGGSAHTCALLDDGVLRCWGLSGNGQLGYGNTNSIGDDETPASAGDVIYR